MTTSAAPLVRARCAADHLVAIPARRESRSTGTEIATTRPGFVSASVRRPSVADESQRTWVQRTSPSTVVVRRGMRIVLALIDDGEVERIAQELLATNPQPQVASPVEPEL